MLVGAGFHYSEVIICAAVMEENLKKIHSQKFSGLSWKEKAFSFQWG